MHASVEKHRPEIVELCGQYGVRTLDVFGSATTDDFDEERSDVDLLVEFSRDVPGMSGLRQYFGFKEALEKLLGRSVDLVEGELENPYLRRSVEQTREPLFRLVS
ncbi:MAG: nucleotidyltransferase domain-containing protein [Geodermatophilaceae bacterium]|nr:nucleotidyltransferase domain-containing protein [Geodermatophilaceae bacterium]